jgi:predicted GH43/DUF377 family glycosyl hydrolase
VRVVDWVREGTILAAARPGAPDSARTMRPWVVEEDGRRRMWYSGHDGTTGRILAAVERHDGVWERQGIAIDAGFSGDSDLYGVESPSVVRTPGEYLMAYAGFDGQTTRLHLAASDDGLAWTSRGAITLAGMEGTLATSHPSLLRTESGWWLFFSTYDGAENSRRARIFAAVSAAGGSWGRVGAVVEPLPGELAASHPCVIMVARTFYMFYASDDGERIQIALASSADGLEWNRHGTTLGGTGEGPEAGGVHTPCAIRCHDGSLRIWYAALPAADDRLGYQIRAARFPGPWSTGV